MISLVLGLLNALAANEFANSWMTARAATPPSAVDTSSVLDLEQSPEEKMVSEGLPPTPESGSENPEDLLKSAAVIHTPTPKPGKKSASAKGTADGLPAALPPIPGSTKPAPISPDFLPPVPSEEASAVAAPAGGDALPAEEPTLPSEPLAEAPALEPPPGEELEKVVVPADAGTSTKKWDRSIPIYERENPSWGLDIHASLQALGTPLKSDQLDVAGNPTGVTEESDVTNFGFGFEYEPAFLQGIGVVSLGPSFNSYVLQPAGDLTKNGFAIYSLGFSAKYQLNFMRGQPIVPFVGYEAQMIRYSFERADVGSGWTTATGLSFGALIALNWMEPSAAHSLWSETGIKRSYLVGEMKNLQAGLDLLSSDGQAIYFGVRLEY